ncbi:tyrosine-type recombinase/integrase [uncultured Arthrobacter sp.]|uniref:tyrosine-type recombinase/integrase n=1 Tax=uncultured Arthrobacter sp. TaxID=114050 RepID=UPI0028D2242E|nr:tyrosine-type recombinase/integrase [uncultured Arthrobacter sp.]
MTAHPVNAELVAALEDYLNRRHALGFQLIEEERHARRFLEWLWARGNMQAAFSATEATTWVRGAGNFKNSYQRQRLSAVRDLSRYCRALGMDAQVPAASALNTGKHRRTPHIYTQCEVDALIAACQEVFTPVLVRATMANIIALLAVSGMRVGEVLRLKPQDIQAPAATMLVRANKHGPDRLIPLHTTTVDALATYQCSPYRQAVRPHPDGPLFVNSKGMAYQRQTVEDHFQRLRAAANFTWEGTAPCLHDFRHTFATRQMIHAYTTDGGNPAARLSLLATWLGHSHPSHTYWYIQAVPELLALAANRMGTAITLE